MSRDGSAATVIAREAALDLALEQALAELRGILRLQGLERTLAIGELILSRFYGGSVSAWRERKRNKLHSIRRLAARRDCPLSRSALNDAVAIFVMVEQLPELRTLSFVGGSHLAAVLALSPTQASQILAQAEVERWSVRTLKQRVAALRPPTARDGRGACDAQLPASIALRRRCEQLFRAVDAVNEARRADPTLAATTDWLANELAALAARLRRAAPGPDVSQAPWRRRTDRSA